jgi:hypothetical protein
MAPTNQPNQPKDDRAGSDYERGPNPAPGGEVDTGDRAVPPYEGRKGGREEPAVGTARAFGSAPPTENPDRPPSQEAPVEQSPADMAPEGVGESTTRRGEDIIKEEGKEPGRIDTGTDESPAERPAGESTQRDRTSIKPGQEG